MLCFSALKGISFTKLLPQQVQRFLLRVTTTDNDVLPNGILQYMKENMELKGLSKYATSDNVIASKRMFDECGVKYRQYECTNRKIELEV